MMTRLTRSLLAGACAAVTLAAFGCNRSADASASATAPTSGANESAAGTPRKMERGGAAADTNAYPAPTGVQTGNYQGGRK